MGGREEEEEEGEEEEEELPDMPTGKAIITLFVGLTLLVFASRMLVWGATEIATALGVSELVIGLTIVAIGTSLPELAASIASALKGHHDIAIGAVVGSNIFNIAAVMAMPGLIDPISLDTVVLSRDYAIMLMFTVLLAVFALWQKPRTISRFEGGILASGYAGYMALLYTMNV